MTRDGAERSSDPTTVLALIYPGWSLAVTSLFCNDEGKEMFGVIMSGTAAWIALARLE